MKYLKSIDSFSEPISEARVTVKRRYTENHPAKNISTAARVRNSVIEAMGDGVLTEEELSKILQELKANKRWLGRNTKLFNISEDQNGIKSYALSPFGKRVMKKTIAVNESKQDLESGKSYKVKRNFASADGEEITTSDEVIISYIGNKFAEIEIPGNSGSTKMEVKVSDLEKYLTESTYINEMKHDRFINEASRWKGKDLYPNWVKPGDINTMPVKNINDLTIGLSYVIRDYGDDAYHGDYELREVEKNYVFVDSAMHSQGGEMIFTKKEMLDAIKSGDIYEQD
tara:strand:- start:778 stop:1632 length:855 start_codon:yes stop_codon:yes gene_type:complete